MSDRTRPSQPGMLVAHGRRHARPSLEPITSRSSPFGAAAPSVVIAVAYAAAVLIWVAAGDRLPGGRWLAVHLFTLGVLTNLVLTFAEHFSRTLTRHPGERAWWWPAITNAGVLGVIVGITVENRWATAAGAIIVSGAVLAAYLRIRRMRKQAIGARFGWIVRVYERAHGAFLHGALLGALLGVGLIPGAWYGGVRSAHLHANVLGWGGLTLLATLVFFGPSMARARITPGADARAAHALRLGATGLTCAVVLLIATGLPGGAGTIARTLAAAGIAVLAWAGTVACWPVIQAVRQARPGAPVPLIIGSCSWLIAVLWLDVAVVAAGRWDLLDILGIAALGGALAQAMLATLMYLAPMLKGRSTAQRDQIRARLDVAARTRGGVFNLGIVMIAVSAVATAPGLAQLGWTMIGAVVASGLALAVAPTRHAAELA